MAELLIGAAASAGAAGSGGGELDERVAAQAALDAAEEQLQSLCASHAGTFVSVERRGRDAERALSDLQAAIVEASAKVAAAQRALDQEGEDDDDDGKGGATLSALAERHRVRRRTLLQHSSLLELLELPSLMDACVRSSLYDEALSIAAFANTLERRHSNLNSSVDNNNQAANQSGGGGSSNLVVTRVVEQIRARTSDLKRHLLFRLKSSVTMPQCLEVVTALRRLNSIDLERQQASATGGTGGSNLERVHQAMETRLQIEFLEARDAWLDSTSANSAAAAGGGAAQSSRHSLTMTVIQPSEQLLDAIERYRTR